METLDTDGSTDIQISHVDRINTTHSYLAELALWDIESPNIIRAEE